MITSFDLLETKLALDLESKLEDCRLSNRELIKLKAEYLKDKYKNLENEVVEEDLVKDSIKIDSFTSI